MLDGFYKAILRRLEDEIVRGGTLSGFGRIIRSEAAVHGVSPELLERPLPRPTRAELRGEE